MNNNDSSNNHVKSTVIFEYPLNEKIRTWLRIEFLLKQLMQNKIIQESNALPFFHSLSELLEIVERNDIRNDLMKDLDEQKQKLSLWNDVPGVDLTVLNHLINQINTVTSSLSTHSLLAQELRQDKLISSIRKRLTIPGGCCNFDLPAFYLWLQLSQQTRDKIMEQWLSSLTTLKDAITLLLSLIRQSGIFETQPYHNNFYQSPTKIINLLRVRIPVSHQAYPLISGNASRYTIRFAQLDTATENIIPLCKFELACC